MNSYNKNGFSTLKFGENLHKLLDVNEWVFVVPAYWYKLLMQSLKNPNFNLIKPKY